MNSLISVNVGLPQDVAWQGKIVRTAIWKRPVTGRIMARRLNLEGDGQGDLVGHGGENRAVMVYQVDSYKHWEAYLGRRNLEHGQFGENLTVEGLADKEVCIGDRYRIGTAVFEVTQPRVTCYRVGIRMDNPEMPALLVSHKRPGFYFRVIEEGEIGAGDEIVKVADGPEHVTVADIDALLYLPGHPRDQLNRALRIPSLSDGWKRSLRALVAAGDQAGNAGLSASLPPPAWNGFRSLRVIEIHRESSDVLSFLLETDDGSRLPTPLAGQFLVFKIVASGCDAPILRSYSMSGPPAAGTYRVSVKRGTGPGSQYFHDRLHTSDLLQVSAPRGSFTVTEGDGPVVFLSAGIGATPVLSMLHGLAVPANESSREIWWCHGARNGREHAFADEVRSVLGSFRRGHSFIAYSQPGDADRLGEDYDATGHLEIGSLQQLNVPLTADFYLCGPTTFIADLSAALKAWGVREDLIHSEAFGSGKPMTPGISGQQLHIPHPPEGPSGKGPMVAFTRSNLTVPWDPRFISLLEFAEACEVPVRWSCRVGVCHTCETGVISGRVKYQPEPLDKPADARILLCCGTPSSEIELDL